jgi:hypothetical protein
MDDAAEPKETKINHRLFSNTSGTLARRLA